MIRLSRRWAATALFFVAAPITLRAQTAASEAASPTDSATVVAAPVAAAPAVVALPASSGPTLANATAGVRAPGAVEQPVVVVRTEAAEDAVPNALPPARGSTRNATALMIVGGAAFIAGALIGDDAGTIIMVGGAGIGLYGLYLYLQ